MTKPQHLAESALAVLDDPKWGNRQRADWAHPDAETSLALQRQTIRDLWAAAANQAGEGREQKPS